MNNSKAGSGGMGLSIPMFLIFLTLKLTGVITWSWWWVTAPLWIVPAVLLTFAGLCYLVAAVIGIVIRD